jgi:hypothetical protein
MASFRWSGAAAVCLLFAASAQDAPPAPKPPADPAFLPTASLNYDLPSWLRFSGEERIRLEGFTGSGFQPNSDVYVLNRFRLNMAVQPLSWLGFHFQTQDARVWWKDQKPYAPPYQDTFDLRVAYAEFGDGERSHVGLRFGRQEINLGEERLVGASPWTNTTRTFDAVRAMFRAGRFRLDAFAASPVALHDGDVGDHQPGNNLHGLYGGLENVVPRSTIEPYLFWRLSQRQKTETGTIGNLDFTTVGVRWVGKLPYRFDYSLEVARQQGSLGTDRIDAWAGHWVLGYTLPTNRRLRLLLEYNYATGDGNAADGRRHTFDQLFPSAHEKYGLADQVGWKNLLQGRTGVEFKPSRRWALMGKYSADWLADAHDALYNSSSSVVVIQANGSAGRFVGTELDGVAVYTFSKQLQIGSGFAHIFPGSFLRRVTPGKAYNYPYLMLSTTL